MKKFDIQFLQKKAAVTLRSARQDRGKAVPVGLFLRRIMCTPFGERVPVTALRKKLRGSVA
ncbi:MAG: hypothetical protein IJ333_09015 [Clostridia bacterium]|nr:hypothetical protein [Clostridia bacterium]